MVRPGTFGEQMTLRDLGALLDLGATVGFERGEILVREGDPATSVFVLHDGWAKISRGDEVVLNLCRSGDIVGEFGVLDGLPRGADVAALTRVTATAIAAQRFHDFLAARPDLMALLSRVLVSRLRRAGDSASDHARPIVERVVRRIDCLAAEHGLAQPDGSVHIDAGFSPHDLAAWLGTDVDDSRETMNRLGDDGLVHLCDGTLVVHDLERLRQLVA